MITRNLLTRSYKLLLTLLVLLMSTNAFAQRLTATGKVTDAVYRGHWRIRIGKGYRQRCCYQCGREFS